MHAFIDESGTLQDQEIMTVALVVLDGARSAEKLHLKASKVIFTPPKTKGLKEREKWFASRTLHFAEMNDDQKLALGSELGRANIASVIASHWHTEASATHEHRFAVYSKLVEMTILRAFEFYKQLNIAIAKQGGWQVYGPPFLEQLRKLPGQYKYNTGQYREADIYLASSANHGIQLADFFASSCRNYLLSKSANRLAEPYERVQHLVVQLDEYK